MIYNSTAIYQFQSVSTPLMVFSSFLSGLLATLPFLMGIIYKYTKNEEEEEEEESDVSDEDEDEKESVENYNKEYLDVFEALKERDLTQEELADLNKKNVKEITPKADIIMTYHPQTEAFWYYTDHLKEISYATLETVARKFVIDHDCKRIFLQTTKPVEEATGATVASYETIDPSTEKPESKSVFVKFKKYNSGMKGAVNNNTTTTEVVEQANHFRYKGKLMEYEETKKPSEINEPTMDYATYKRMLESIKEN